MTRWLQGRGFFVVEVLNPTLKTFKTAVLLFATELACSSKVAPDICLYFNADSMVWGKSSTFLVPCGMGALAHPRHAAIPFEELLSMVQYKGTKHGVGGCMVVLCDTSDVIMDTANPTELDDMFNPFASHWNVMVVHGRAPSSFVLWKTMFPENSLCLDQSPLVTALLDAADAQVGAPSPVTMTSLFGQVRQRISAEFGTDFALWMEVSSVQDVMVQDFFCLLAA